MTQELQSEYDSIMNRFASARMLKIMGQHQEAVNMLQDAEKDFESLRSLFDGQPGWHALCFAREAAFDFINRSQEPCKHRWSYFGLIARRRTCLNCNVVQTKSERTGKWHKGY